MEVINYLNFVAALAFVVGLIWFIGYVMRRTGLDKRLRGATGAQGRLGVVDVIYLDPKRKLTLVRADEREYLLLIAHDHVHVVDTLTTKKDV